MVSEMKAKVVYTQLLKEDLVVIRILPDEGMPDYITGQFLTIGVTVPTENYKLVPRLFRICN
jgi:ferredoxin--NADP+ reductase